VHPWLRVGKRFDYTIALVAIVSYFAVGFLFTRTAPIEIRWIVWILTATLVVPMYIAGLLVGRWVRRRDLGAPSRTNANRRPVSARTRLKIYLVVAGVTAVSASEQAKAILSRRLFAATISDIFLWNFAALGVLVAIYELILWRKHQPTKRG
jgi:hypothetical protein